MRCSSTKKRWISRSASLEKSKLTKNPFSHFARRIAVSKASMSGRPALSFCFTCIA